MKKILSHLFEHKTLPRGEARQVLENISAGQYTESEIASFITVYLMRSITLEELRGFRDALLGLAVPCVLTGELTDIVGTGGDGKNTFNISTLSCFIVAGARQKVAKHGNYSASSISGASNVMEHLGYSFTNDAGILQRQLDDANICFLHAPLFHPALKKVSGIRKNLALRTFFNMLGPLVNPANPALQLIGVSSLEIARMYTYLLQEEQKNYCIVHSLDGYDEISLTSDVKIIRPGGEKIMSAREIGKRTVAPADIFGGSSVDDAAAIFLSVLRGEGTWAQNAVVLSNAAMALHTNPLYPNFETCYQLAVNSLESGNAYKCFTKIVA
ncbi:MAG: anthranilate phosphoribosyltransferase [Ferruginibacter sp.]